MVRERNILRITRIVYYRSLFVHCTARIVFRTTLSNTEDHFALSVSFASSHDMMCTINLSSDLTHTHSDGEWERNRLIFFRMHMKHTYSRKNTHKLKSMDVSITSKVTTKRGRERMGERGEKEGMKEKYWMPKSIDSYTTSLYAFLSFASHQVKCKPEKNLHLLSLALSLPSTVCHHPHSVMVHQITECREKEWRKRMIRGWKPSGKSLIAHSTKASVDYSCKRTRKERDTLAYVHSLRLDGHSRQWNMTCVCKCVLWL